MIETAFAIPNGQALTADVCIVGAGAAGISAALALANTRLSVILLESGGEKEDKETQALYEGEVVDERLHSPPDKYRQRRWGGSTTIWGGRCMPFDPIDFAHRSYIPDSGWPITYEELKAFYPEANALLEAGDFLYQAELAEPAGFPQVIKDFTSPLVRTDGLERFSMPTDMGKRYRSKLEAARNVRVIQNANCTAILLDEAGEAVTSVEVKTLRGAKFTVAASNFILATGGLEVVRLLLASNNVQAHGIGNAHGNVGRYYQCHIAANVGKLTIFGQPSNSYHGYHVTPDGIYCRRRFQLTETAQRENELCNMVARLHFPPIVDPAHKNGVLSGLYIARHFIGYEYGKRLHSPEKKGIAHELKHLINIATHPGDVTGFLAHWLRYRTFSTRKFPSVILKNRSNEFSLEVHAEQTPLRDSRVTLTDTQDSLGMPRIRVDWRYAPADIDMVSRSLDLMSKEFSRTGKATLKFNRDELEKELTRYGAYGGHHIGTTRMGSDPRTSVVDSTCTVHGVRNLHVASAAVFPTSSQANPTLTVVAVALRLARHIAKQHDVSARPLGMAA